MKFTQKESMHPLRFQKVSPQVPILTRIWDPMEILHFDQT